MQQLLPAIPFEWAILLKKIYLIMVLVQTWRIGIIFKLPRVETRGNSNIALTGIWINIITELLLC